MNGFVLVLVVVLVLENAEAGWDFENENEEEDEWVGSWRGAREPDQPAIERRETKSR